MWRRGIVAAIRDSSKRDKVVAQRAQRPEIGSNLVTLPRATIHDGGLRNKTSSPWAAPQDPPSEESEICSRAASCCETLQPFADAIVVKPDILAPDTLVRKDANHSLRFRSRSLGEPKNLLTLTFHANSSRSQTASVVHRPPSSCAPSISVSLGASQDWATRLGWPSRLSKSPYRTGHVTFHRFRRGVVDSLPPQGHALGRHDRIRWARTRGERLE